MTAEKIMFTESELQALEAYGSNWVYDSHGQFIKSASLVADNLLRLRGWGHLTGGGALNLSKEEAEKLQDALGSLLTKLPQMVAYIQAAQGNQQVSEKDIQVTSAISSAIGWLSAFAEKEGKDSRHYHYIGLLEASLAAINKLD